MPPPWHPTTGGLRLKAASPLRCLGSPEERQLEPKYFGGPLLNIHGLLDKSTIYTISDGTRVVFDADPRSAANSELFMPMGQRNEYLFPPADLSHLVASESFEVFRRRVSEPPNSPILAKDSIMASSTENNRLLLLADVALGTYSQEGQKPAHTAPAQGQQSVQFPSSPNAATTNLLPSAEQPSNSASKEWVVFDDNSPSHEQQPTQTSTQGANITTTANASPPAQQQPAQSASSHGFTPINPAAILGGFAPINPPPRRRNIAAPILPSGGRQRAGKRSKNKPRTTGFNRRTGEGMLTNVCGIVTPASNGLPVRSSNKSGGFCCPRCNSQYTRPRSVKDHFITCVNKHGNPNGLSWWDHATLADTQAWHFAHLPTVKEEDEYESEEDEGDQAYGNEEEQNEEEEGDGDVQEQIEVDDGAAAGEEDHEGDSRMGDEERGRDDSIPPGSTGYYTPREGTPHYPSFPGTPLFAPFPGASPPYVLFPGTPLHATNEGSDTPGYGPEGYRTPALTNFREWSATPQHDGGSYTPSFGRGYETPVQEFPYDSDQSRNTSVIRRRETEGYGDETPTPFTDDDGDSVMG